MLSVDLRTIVIITGLISCMMSVVLYALKRSYPRSIGGLLEWAVFPLLAFIASILYGMQGVWHHLVSMAVPNTLVVIALIAFLRGTYRHYGLDINRKLIYAIVLVALAFNL